MAGPTVPWRVYIGSAYPPSYDIDMIVYLTVKEKDALVVFLEERVNDVWEEGGPNILRYKVEEVFVVPKDELDRAMQELGISMRKRWFG